MLPLELVYSIRRNPRDSSSALDAPRGPYGPSVTSSSSDSLHKHNMQLKRKRSTQPRVHPPISRLLKNISPTASPDHKRTRARAWLSQNPPDIDSKTKRRLLLKRKKRKPRKMLQLFLAPMPSSKKSALKPAHDPLDSTATECLPSGTPVQTVLSLSRSPDPAFLDNNFVT